jgi:hypothetical protein
MKDLTDVARRDEGVALITVIGVLVLCTIIVIAGFVLSEQALHESVRTRNQSAAFQAASAGLDAALADVQVRGFQPTNFPMSGTVGASGSYLVTLTPMPDSEYWAVSTGTSPSGAKEVIQTRFFYMNLWEMNLAAGSQQSLQAGTGALRGTTSITGPFYMKGTMDLSGNSSMEKGPLFIYQGDLNRITNGSSIGTAADPIRVFVTGALRNCTDVNSVHISYRSSSVPNITLPKVDAEYLESAYDTAISESFDNLMGPSSSIGNLESSGGDPATYSSMVMGVPFSGNRSTASGASSHYKYIGPESGPSAQGAGTTPLVIGGTGSWGKWDYNTTSGLVHDDFAFDDVNKILYIEGTVFVDGPITFNGDIRHKGNGTLVSNGSITVNGSLTPYSPTNNFDDTTALKWALGLVTPLDLVCNAGGANLKSATDWPDAAGAWFVGGSATFTKNVLFRGSMLAGVIDAQHNNLHLVTNPLLPTYLPSSLPGRGMSFLNRGNISRP